MEDNTVAVSRIYKVDGDSKLKAFVDISLGGIVIKGLRIVSGANGLFLGMPRHQGKDGKWYNTVYPTNKEIHQELTELVLAAYQE
ncbi:MAG: SpoVG family protein [Candidatus Omnitrophica bacterium]|nr:SpoVG family protein [Candidatus Omnitrophota bacterium]MBU4346452.1 SpoVG family protein [Candidatus Omnitrophota bacterium]MBU4472982.1 SpoVG family protein [Candidatus Omnitrophota bacterium]MCG2706949.1 SpoVG family protein [Candidatus Omnitrophota bacterium]